MIDFELFFITSQCYILLHFLKCMKVVILSRKDMGVLGKSVYFSRLAGVEIPACRSNCIVLFEGKIVGRKIHLP